MVDIFEAQIVGVASKTSIQGLELTQRIETR